MKEFTRSGLVLKEYRKNLNLTQAEFGAPYGLHSQFISNHERGKCLPPVHAMQEIILIKDFPRKEFEQALMQDLFEAQMQKYLPRKRQKLKRAPKSKSVGNIGINV